MKYPWAVFDVDGTLFPPSSMEKMFILHMLKHCAIPVFNIFSYFLTGGIKTITDGYEEGFKNNKFYLKGLPAEPVIAEGRHFIYSTLLPMLSERGRVQVNRFRNRGFKIMIMSGSPEFLTLPLSTLFEPDHVVAAVTEKKHFHFTGRLEGLHPYGIRKKKILLGLQDKLQIDFPASIVFANHRADIVHMKLFGTAVAVNPDSGLLQAARNQNWTIEKW